MYSGNPWSKMGVFRGFGMDFGYKNITKFGAGFWVVFDKIP